MRRKCGFTILELLIVLAIIGIVGTIGVINGNQIAQRERAHGALATVQQSVWQGATAAASRGRVMELIYDGDDLSLVDAASDETMRVFELPSGASTNLPSGVVLRFLPPGKVDQEMLQAVNELEDGAGLVLDTGERSYALQISLIGEVIAKESS